MHTAQNDNTCVTSCKHFKNIESQSLGTDISKGEWRIVVHKRGMEKERNDEIYKKKVLMKVHALTHSPNIL